MNVSIPTTEQVRADYAEDNFGRLSEFHFQQFDRWLASVKAEAWDEGFNAGHYLPNESRECDCRNNPYRTE